MSKRNPKPTSPKQPAPSAPSEAQWAALLQTLPALLEDPNLNNSSQPSDELLALRKETEALRQDLLDLRALASNGQLKAKEDVVPAKEKNFLEDLVSSAGQLLPLVGPLLALL